ncbi:MAG: MBL fold metallo-hydrolase [Bacteroides sp.]|nr:MBL fold metallo-hydrolase [Roseburia sp.]MCM1347664.1 MBL fold metallo-hydrolase [Bacteroides sp.]MCM1422098.1 MBL fold metallo-hydrolase [Bacteroides sp.]
MKITILGSGTSTGVPQVGCGCEVCTSTDPHDKRLRCSALIETKGKRILIDCGPDFRQQMLSVPFEPLHAILVTHEHYDHVGGLDDLRPFCAFGEVNVYAEDFCARHLEERIPYCFTPKEKRYPGVPSINLTRISPHTPFYVDGIEIMPLRVMHGKLPILGFRIGSMAYITDMKTIPETELPLLKGIKLLLVNALRHEPHPSHQTVEEATAFARLIGAEQTVFIHMSHNVGLHAEEDKGLPEGFRFAYDGMEIACQE